MNNELPMKPNLLARTKQLLQLSLGRAVAPRRLGYTLFCLATASACSTLPPGIEPVSDFDINRYTGTWYEIIRLENRFERGLSRVTATYSVRDDGSVKVVNRGYAADEGAWKEAIGKAKFSGESSRGRLKVSFFGPFYAPYVIFDLDQTDYQHAFVTGGENTLWLLARAPEVEQRLIDRFLDDAKRYGYNLDELVYVSQGPP